MSDLSKIKVIFSDIDGTLLPVTGKDLKPTAALFEKLIQAGYTLIPCTGRGSGNIPREIWNIPGVPAVITGNGALVINRANGSYLREARVPYAYCLEVLQYLRQFTGSVLCYRDGHHYVDNRISFPRVPEGEWAFGSWLGSATPIDMLQWLLDNPGPLDKMGYITFDQELKLKIEEGFKKLPFAQEFFLSRSATWNIEINMKHANKGEAAAWLLNYLGFLPEEMLACGDNLNDMPMLELAGVSVAPANSRPEVLAAVTHRVADCREDGVEHFLEQLL